MKKVLFLLLLFSGTALAQQDNQDTTESETKQENTLQLGTDGVPTTYTKDVVSVPVKLKWGILGQLNPGFTYGVQSDLEKDLDSTFSASSDYSNNPLGMLLGGSIDVIIGSKIMVGVGGMRLNYNRRTALGSATEVDADPEIGSAHSYWSFVGARVGYLLMHKARYRWDPSIARYEYTNSFLLYPYAGYHFIGQGTLEVENYSSEDIYFGGRTRGELIQPVEKKEFTATQGLVELGLGAKWARNKQGGLTFGLELGGYFG